MFLIRNKLDICLIVLLLLFPCPFRGSQCWKRSINKELKQEMARLWYGWSEVSLWSHGGWGVRCGCQNKSKIANISTSTILRADKDKPKVKTWNPKPSFSICTNTLYHERSTMLRGVTLSMYLTFWLDNIWDVKCIKALN